MLVWPLLPLLARAAPKKQQPKPTPWLLKKPLTKLLLKAPKLLPTPLLKALKLLLTLLKPLLKKLLLLSNSIGFAV